MASTARQLQIPCKTLHEWVDGRNQHRHVAKLRLDKTEDLGDKLEAIARQCANLLPSKLPDASVRETTSSMAIAVEKMLLLRGQATSITSTPAQLDQLNAKLTAIIDLADPANIRQLSDAQYMAHVVQVDHKRKTIPPLSIVSPCHGGPPFNSRISCGST